MIHSSLTKHYYFTGIITAKNHVTSKQQQWRIPLKNPVDSDKTSFDISVNTGQICMGFEAETPEKRPQPW